MISTNINFALFDLAETMRLFEGAEDLQIAVNLTENSNDTKVSVILNENTSDFYYPKISGGELEIKRYQKRYLKLSLYLALSAHFDKCLPWGSLTGIRPVKLAYQLISQSGEFEAEFKDFFKVTVEKTQLVKDILTAQVTALQKLNGSSQLFVNIPFCPSKCNYCSFLSAVVKNDALILKEYTAALTREIDAARQICKNPLTAYIGGGTPIILSGDILEQVLKSMGGNFLEFTVEAGRADCITTENLKLLKKYGVTRVCINPQSFNDETLKKIGRTHTAGDVANAFNLARSLQLDINCDLIAGLEGETPEMFYKSVDRLISLMPQNITIHTLSLKKGSQLKLTQNRLSDRYIDEMLDFANYALKKAGYVPYYMYRQKYTAANRENVGYTLPSKECLYNIAIMEEITDIIACGANAISKRIFSGEERIERLKNPKDIKTYFEKLNVIIEGKENFFK